MAADLKGQRVSVIGLGKSGISLAHTLTGLGAQVLASDRRPVAELPALPCEVEGGGHTARVWQDRDLVVISPGVPFDLPILQEARQHGVPVIGEVELAYRLSPAPIIAITGTNGKSTTTTLIYEMLRAAGRDAILAGNIGIPMTGEVVHAQPGGWIVAEISSFQLESIETFRPHVAVVLNVTSDHLDRHPSFEAYVAAKARIFENQTESDFAVLNDDDPVVREMHSRAQVLRFSRGQAIEVPAECPLQGPHNLENILAAATVANALNVPPEALQQALRNFHPLHHRMERVGVVNGVIFIDDSKGTNPGAVIAALESVQTPIVLIAGGKDKLMEFDTLARAMARRVKAAVLIGEAAPRIEAAARAEGMTALHRTTTFEAAVQRAQELAAPGDTVLLSPACASFDMFRSAEERGEIFARLVREQH
ncbi:MAG: UDP-N-acetylmuramoyl-L-alanine--D-glutamate ligase [Candidatus Xenobia bacterium]